MKKPFRILLRAVMLCFMLVVFAMPAEAEEFTCETWDDVAYAIAHGGSDVTINLTKSIVYSTYAIDINRPCNIAIKNESEYTWCDISGCFNETYYSRAFIISADDVTLDLSDNISVYNFHPNTEKGGAIYITGEDCVINGGEFYWCMAKYGGAIYLEDGSSTTIKNARFDSNYRADYGGAIYANDDAVIDHCVFDGNSSAKAGGAIYDNNDYGEVKITWCTFENNEAYDVTTDTLGTGMWVYGGGDAVIDYCTFSGGDTEHYYYDCEKVTNSVGSTDPQQFIRPIASRYAQTAMAGNENCDVICRDENNPVKSDKEYFTLTANASDAFGWRAKDDSPLTITAKEGYIITAIEGHVPAYEYNGAKDYEYLIADHGTKSVDEAYLNIFGEVRGDIDVWIKIDNINSDSLTLTTRKDRFHDYTMFFDEIIVYYEKNATLASVFSGGMLWIIIGAAAVAAMSAVVIIVVKKKKKSVTVNGAAAEDSEKEDKE